MNKNKKTKNKKVNEAISNMGNSGTLSALHGMNVGNGKNNRDLSKENNFK